MKSVKNVYYLAFRPSGSKLGNREGAEIHEDYAGCSDSYWKYGETA